MTLHVTCLLPAKQSNSTWGLRIYWAQGSWMTTPLIIDFKLRKKSLTAFDKFKPNVDWYLNEQVTLTQRPQPLFLHPAPNYLFPYLTVLVQHISWGPETWDKLAPKITYVADNFTSLCHFVAPLWWGWGGREKVDLLCSAHRKDTTTNLKDPLHQL